MSKDQVKFENLKIEFCGRELSSPFILSSGPLCYGAEGIIKAHQAGAGAVVTKTIRLEAAVNPIAHIHALGKQNLINAEKWGDITLEQWCTKEIPQAVKAGVTVIASVGHTLREAKAIVEEVQTAGAHMIELVSYREETLLPMLKYTKEHVHIPVICKISGNWDDPVASALRCIENGADGICAIDSIGPVLSIDVLKARPVMFGNDGYGWLTGEAIRPIAMRIVADIARNAPEFKNIYGSGGVMSAENALEYIMAGAIGTGICTLGIQKGVGIVQKLCAELSALLEELGYENIASAHRAALMNFPEGEQIRHFNFSFQAFKEDGSAKCVQCKRCEQVCCYDARKLNFPEMSVDPLRCRNCGLCLDVCPTAALTATWAEQSEGEKTMALRSKQFDQSMQSI